jgi:DNA (cytosine-5)-methyltransferase 1
MALDRLGIEYESVGISEIDKYALKSYMAIHGDTKNFGSICDIKGQDLPQIDVFTWSFPCTDLSKAGHKKGLQGGTRSGLVYEVLRILQECKLSGNLPKVLIMENVVDLVQQKFVREFQEIQVELESIGYMNYTQTLNSKDYGVAQNRDRAFMVSILGEYYYEFPQKIKLEKRLKDYLEENVDPKYYLSDAMLNYCTDMEDRNGYIRGERFNPHNLDESNYAFAITTKPGSRAVDNFIIIPEATIKGYTEAYDGDGVYINRPHQKRGVVQDGMIQTLKTTCNSDIGVVVTDLKREYCNTLIENNLVDEGDMIRHSYTNSRLEDMGRKENENGISATLTTRPDTLGVVVIGNYSPSNHDASRIVDNNGIAPTVKENHGTVTATNHNLRIRKLTPLECWRLMGIDDSYFNKAKVVNSNAQLYKQCGNGIVIDVFAKIIETMIGDENV